MAYTDNEFKQMEHLSPVGSISVRLPGIAKMQNENTEHFFFECPTYDV